MNINTLDNLLRNLTPHEKQYKEGSSYFSFQDLPTTVRNGREVRIMDFTTSSFSINSNLLYLKKQSRYQACPMHIHNWIEINYIYSGRCPQIINNESYVLEKGQVALIDTDTPHSTDILGDDDIMVSLVINKDYLTSNFFNRFSQDSILSAFFINAISKNTQHDNYILFHSEQSRKLPLYFNELLCEMYAPSINSSDIVNSLFTLILCELINVYEDDMERQNLNMSRNSVGPILRFIEGNYNSCTLESTAGFFNMNPNYLTTLLKKRTGHSYKELVQRQRLIRAGRLLRNTDLNVTDIANTVGYENVSFFYKKFKEEYGCSPKEYRHALPGR